MAQVSQPLGLAPVRSGELQIVVGVILQDEDVVLPADAVDLPPAPQRCDGTCAGLLCRVTCLYILVAMRQALKRSNSKVSIFLGASSTGTAA